MSVIWSKVLRDLWGHKSRTILVVLSTSIGVFALGLVFSLSNLMTDRMRQDYFQSSPAHIEVWGGPFDQETVESIGELEGIARTEGQARMNFRWKKVGETDWHNGQLVARRDYENQQMNFLDLAGGFWPGKRNLTIERQSALYYNIPPGSTIIVQFNKGQQLVTVDGVVRDPAVFPPQFGGDATFIGTEEGQRWITGYEDYNSIFIQLEDYSDEWAQEVALEVKYRLNRAGANFGGYYITDPNEHWMQETLDTLTIILAVIGGLSLAIGAFLVINTVIALMAQQVWQIGVMKVIGATKWKVLSLYLANIFMYGVLACLIAIPTSIVTAYKGSDMLLGMLNISSGPFRYIPNAIFIQLLTGLLMPVIAAVVPVIAGARITPHQAITTHGVGSDFGTSFLDRLMSRIHFLASPVALSLRNSFRRKVRVSLTLLTLIMAGVIFIMVMSLGTSLDKTLEALINNLGMDIWVGLEEPKNIPQLESLARQMPGVEDAEVWNRVAATLSLGRDQERDLNLIGLPTNTNIFQPRIVSGRSLLPGDGYAIVLNNKIAVEEGIQAGDKIKLTIGDKDREWMVIGIIMDVSEGQTNCYVPIDALGREISNINRGSLVMIKTGSINSQQKTRLIDNLRTTYTRAGLKPSFFLSADEIRQQSKSQFSLITSLMLGMAILMALVGAIGLMGTMSLNVVERGREVGVMRSIGATSLDVAGIFLIEGILLGLISWAASLPFSYPASESFSKVVGETLLALPLDYQYSMNGIFVWLAIVIGLSALASLWPAIRASHLRIRETLSYE